MTGWELTGPLTELTGLVAKLVDQIFEAEWQSRHLVIFRKGHKSKKYTKIKVKNIRKFEMFKINFFRNGSPHKSVSNYISWQWLLSTALLVCPRTEMQTCYIHWEDCMTGRQWYRQYEHNVYTACKQEHLDSLRGKCISWCTQELQILC